MPSISSALHTLTPRSRTASRAEKPCAVCQFRPVAGELTVVGVVRTGDVGGDLALLGQRVHGPQRAGELVVAHLRRNRGVGLLVLLDRHLHNVVHELVLDL